MRDMGLRSADAWVGGSRFEDSFEPVDCTDSRTQHSEVAARQNIALSIVFGVLGARQDDRRIERLAQADALRHLRRANETTIARAAAASGLINRLMTIPGTSAD